MADQQGGLMGMLLPLALFVVIFYFLIIRPQKKRQRQQDEMLASIRVGDSVVTAGGFFGVVKALKDDSFIVEIADGVRARIMKSSISIKRNLEDRASSGKKEESAPEIEATRPE